MATINNVGELMQVVRDWEQKFFNPGLGFPHIWYRGHADASWELQPTVLRQWFIARPSQLAFGLPGTIGLVNLERTINNQYRRMVASMLPAENSLVDMYFLMQHHGMPTRLLDWTTNPLAALFFAVTAQTGKDGVIYVMNPRQLIPPEPDSMNSVYPSDVVYMRDTYVQETVRTLFGEGDRPDNPFVLPIMPDLRAGRMLQQGACFTLHMPPVVPQHSPPPVEPVHNIAIADSYIVPAAAKADLLVDLRRLSINYATLFPDTDNVSREIRTAWNLYP